MSVESSVDAAASDVVWGAKAIGQEIGLSERRAFHRLERGHIRCAKKVGNSWVSTKPALKRLVTPEAT
jgi:hypothetical protein